MPSNYSFLPLDPPVAYVKPTPSNTHGGKTYVPTHPQLFRVEFSTSAGAEESFSSRLVASREYGAGEVICHLENVSQAHEKAYSSVQYGPGETDHLELNSDLLFMNHSCAPTVELDLSSPRPEHWSVRTLQVVRTGEPLTFFYPSTEWNMAQGFDCSCGAETCLRRISGAKCLSLDELERRGGLSRHIRTLKREQDNARA